MLLAGCHLQRMIEMEWRKKNLLGYEEKTNPGEKSLGERFRLQASRSDILTII